MMALGNSMLRGNLERASSTVERSVLDRTLQIALAVMDVFLRFRVWDFRNSPRLSSSNGVGSTVRTAD